MAAIKKRYDILMNLRSRIDSRGIRELRKLMDQLGGNLSETVNLMKKFIAQKNEAYRLEKLRGARLGYNLSLLFSALSVSRAINNNLKDWFKTYDQITKGQTEFGNSIKKLSASFSFLKFVIIDTFSRSEVVEKFMNSFAKFAEGVANFVAAHPTISVGVVVGGVAISKLATLAAWVAQFTLLSDAVKTLKAIKAATTTVEIATEGLNTIPLWLTSLIAAGTITTTVLVSVKLKGVLGKVQNIVETVDSLSQAIKSNDLAKSINELNRLKELKSSLTFSDKFFIKLAKWLGAGDFLGNLDKTIKIYQNAVDALYSSEKSKLLSQTPLGQLYVTAEDLVNSVTEVATQTDNLMNKSYASSPLNKLLTDLDDAINKAKELQTELDKVNTSGSLLHFPTNMQSSIPPYSG